MRCPGCGTPIAEVRNVPVEYVTNSKGYFPGEEHTSTRCHASDPVRKAAREYLEWVDSKPPPIGEEHRKDAVAWFLRQYQILAALRAALEG